MTNIDTQLLHAVSLALGEPPDDDPEVSADMLCETILNGLDQLMVLAAKDDTAHLVMANRIFVGQILVRAQLIASFLMAQKTGLRIIRNSQGPHVLAEGR